MYDRNYWVNHVVDQSGAVIQQGTLQDQEHFNKMELGICDGELAEQIRAFGAVQQSYTDTEETIDIEVTNNTITKISWLEKGASNTAAAGGAPAKWPFGASPVTVALAYNRNTENYTVDVYVTGHSGGMMGNITVADKALNGFKLLHDGTAKSWAARIKIRGGLTV